MVLTLIDGRPVHNNRPGVLTWGCAYGYGLFETILIQNNQALFLKQHLRRMRASARFLRLAMPPDEQLIQWVKYLLETNRLPAGKLKITLLADEPVPGAAKIASRVIITVQPGQPYPAEFYETGVAVGLLKQIKNEQSELVKHKTLNYLENFLGREQARKNNWFEGLFCNTKGRLCEGTVSNLFIIKDQNIITPGESEGLLPGVTREFVINLARKNNLPLTVGQITIPEFFAAEEIFLTNSLFGIMPVTRRGEMLVGDGKPGRLTGQLIVLYRTFIEDSVSNKCL
ncbi:aminotransferase class IV [Desulforamulus hydrothermalis]|uniref:Aminotransferase class IV n=1 Tax=Desulforamulus hydrothermalis Lam5 = DSM 18033 TaxID=1121428 RepID=K8DZ16_9FIRM|nr:aminotransferase class IV [Desulforamulus hydrothermalis]CCO08199.1 Aminotransferase class IV [Desulforamulus hydrothermalis Lam5 = DSM 18033]SHH22614.1 branched-chain amino acid aminotransferase [Desulforamulus hydrothermalis Lam5 = DSM 18033]